MKGEVVWTEGKNLLGISSSGVETSIYGNVGASPMELVLQSHAACSMIDVIVGLKDRMDNVEVLRVEIESDRAEQSPRIFTAVRMKYFVKGDVPRALVERLIKQSHEKHCSVGKMITGAGATLEWSLDFS